MEIYRKLNGIKWTIKVVGPKEMKKYYDEDVEAGGLCVPEDKVILIDEDCLTYNTVVHELYHAYWSDLCLVDTNHIPINEIEEIAACLFENKAEIIIRKAKRIYKDLKKLQGET